MHKIIFSSLLVTTAILFYCCKPETIKTYETIESGDLNSIVGVWKGQSVTQRDNDAERKNFPYKSMDVTAPLSFAEVKLTLNASNNQPSTFNIDYGTAPKLFKLTSGNWKVDNTQKVGKLWLYNGLDTVKLTLGSYNLIANNKLQLVWEKALLGKSAITYESQFTK